ncbi:MAG: N4-gp56 family major capsid protein [Clostridia bacterium]|nr:N4-gp56 family major capsid protein [Clostridia bacterium]
MSEITKMENMINPEVMGDMLDAKIEAQLKLTPYAKVDTTLQGVPGDTKTVPSWKYIGDAEDVAEGEEVDTTKMETGKETFTVKKAMKSVSITQEAINSGLGNPVGQAEVQLAKSIAGKVDNDVLEAVYKGQMTAGDGSKQISYEGIVDSSTKFEDEEDGIEKVLFIHPAQEATILKDSNFISADKYEAGVMVRGAIGKVAGCQVKKSKKVRLVTHEKDNTATTGATTITADNLTEYQNKIDPTVKLSVGDKVKAIASASQYYVCPVIKMEADSKETEYTEDELPAITIFLKKDTSLDHDWYPRKQTHELTTARYYGVALTNSAKIVLAKFKK